MTVVTQKSALAKPFLKWAGGKSQLLDEIDRRLLAELITGRIDGYIKLWGRCNILKKSDDT